MTATEPRRSLVAMVEQARERLERMEIACRRSLDARVLQPPPREVELLQIQVEQLKRRLVDVVHRREDSDAIFHKAMAYAAAKGTANAVLHALFDQASAGKCQVLEQWLETGVIPTRDGLKHWRLDLREIRNETGASVLHVAVDASIARQNLKVKLVELLVDRVGFDVNVRDAFGRTPLHVASMAGLAEVTQALLARGADASLRDRAGLTPLSVVRTLSRPPEEIVQLLANAESAKAREYKASSNRIAPKTAITSALFLRILGRFVLPEMANDFTKQTNSLIEALLQIEDAADIPFDETLRLHVPLLFEDNSNIYSREAAARSTPQLVRLDSLFQPSMFWDGDFVDELKLEAVAYGHSLVTSNSTATAGPTWEGFILKLIQRLKLEMASPSLELTTHIDTTLPWKEDAVSDTDASSTSEPSQVRSPIYAGQVPTRQAWHYAVLYKAATHSFPGTLSVKKGDVCAISSEDVGRFFPLEDRLLIGSSEYHCLAYDPSTRTIQLDREYEGANAAEVKAYLAGSYSSLYPPYISTKRILEREPGNKYEDHMSNEQELFQDYQFLNPDSEYEVAIKLGPLRTSSEARKIADDWRAHSRKLFEEKKCQSGVPSCSHYCPQRNGHSLCVDTMAAIGRELAKERLGRPTFSKQLKPRASLQKYQSLFLGKAPWPGSPSTVSKSSEPRLSAMPADLDLT